MKTQLIEGAATIRKHTTACIGVMPWESPRIKFVVGDHVYTWHSDNIYPIIYKFGLEPDDLEEGASFNVKVRVRRGQVWRMLGMEAVKEGTLNSEPPETARREINEAVESIRWYLCQIGRNSDHTVRDGHIDSIKHKLEIISDFNNNPAE